MKLYIGNKNYSSWSLRSWLLMTHASIAFEEIRLRLDFEDGSAFKRALRDVGAGGTVPVLVDDDGFAVWDTLAIAEYLAEKFPAKRVWPQERQARARARSYCAEMHAGFAALRNHCPMNLEAALPDIGATLLQTVPALRLDLARIETLWTEALSRHGGDFLFGEFSAADAYFAPVCSRIVTYGLPAAPAVAEYVARILDLPAMQAWTQAALAEHDFLPVDEPYRRQT